jgi:asparagine synthase (glutamine-hydrolysing)
MKFLEVFFKYNITGYLYFHSAPNAEALQHECIDRIKNLHTSDCLRANKSTMAWGLEARVPFLDKNFLDVAMTIPPSTKTSRAPPYNHEMEKYVLRAAFDTPNDPYLPKDILWRQKEQFSDGVGYSWIDSLRDYANDKISDTLMSQASTLYPVDTPTTKEAFLYRQIFSSLYPQAACLESVVRWIPRADWGNFKSLFLGCPSDPSGRAQKAHAASYKK